MRLYDRVKELMEQYPSVRNSDRKLIWAVWNDLGLCQFDHITVENYEKSPSLESITRARRKVQELHPELQATKSVRSARLNKETKFPSWVFREEVKGQIKFL